MAPEVAPAGLALLRSISYRIANIKPKQLPRTLAAQVQGLKDCDQLLSQPKSSSQIRGDVGIVVHRYLTQVAALLQGRTVEERWSAAVLVKATVEAGDYEVLSKCKHWVSGLLMNLRRPDPPSTKALYITTLTRIFTLTWPYPSLIRDITTPSLGPFIKTCLGNVAGPHVFDVELRVVLESFSWLLPHHTTTFRSHAIDIKQLLERVTCISDDYVAQRTGLNLLMVSEESVEAAERLSVLVHATQPKGGAAGAWEQDYHLIIERVHRSLDVVFYDVEERLDLSVELRSIKSTTAAYIKDQSPQLRLESMSRNAERSINSFKLLTTFMDTSSACPVGNMVGEAYKLFQRIMSCEAGHTGSGPRFGSVSTAEERDLCHEVIPRLHIACLHLVHDMAIALQEASPGFSIACIPLIANIFPAEGHMSNVRQTIYHTLHGILPYSTQSMGKETIEDLTAIIKSCCTDVLLHRARSAASGATTNGNTAGPDQLLKSDKQEQQKTPPSTELQQDALKLLRSFYKSLDGCPLPQSIRTLMDRTSIITRDSEALLNSTLFPGSGQEGRPSSSLLPFLARESPDDPMAEALLRPRMPVLQSGQIVALQLNDVEHQRDLGDATFENSLGRAAETANMGHGISDNIGRIDGRSGARKRSLDDDEIAADEGEAKRPRMKVNKGGLAGLRDVEMSDEPPAKEKFEPELEDERSVLARMSGALPSTRFPGPGPDTQEIPNNPDATVAGQPSASVQLEEPSLGPAIEVHRSTVKPSADEPHGDARVDDDSDVDSDDFVVPKLVLPSDSEEDDEED